MINRTQVAALVTTALVSSMAASPAFAQAAVNFNLPAQELSKSLKDVARATNTNVVFDPRQVRGKQAPALSGKFDAETAIARLIAGQSLTQKNTGSGTFVISGGTPQGNAPAAAETAASSGEAAAVASAGESERTQQTIVVTGTNIRGVAPPGAPLTTYNRTDIERSGVSTVDQFLRTIPQDLASADATTQISNRSPTQTIANAYYGAAANLHGLGPGATLVLVNGQRLAPSGDAGGFIDVSAIPLSAVERVEVLTDGASAIYGADAVAGVINFTLKRDYDGASTGFTFGGATDGGGQEIGATQLVGHSWDTGNVMLSYEFLKNDPVYSSQRDFIPPQTRGLIIAIPGQKRQSIFISGHQSIGQDAELFFDGDYGKRNFRAELISGPVSISDTGRASQYGATVGVRKTFANNWRAELTTHASRVKQSSLELFSGRSTTFNSMTKSGLSSITVRADGPILATPGGEMRMSIGGEFRREALTADTQRLTRNDFSGYGEIYIPIVGANNSLAGVKELVVSLAARYDHYSSAGSATSPRVGVRWSVANGITLRASYGTSYQVPTLLELSDALPINSTELLPNPSAPSGTTDTLILNGSGNSKLRAETSRAFTVGGDVRPKSIPGLVISATYYDIDFRDRIASPPLSGTVFSAFSQFATLAPFFNLAPSESEIQNVFAESAVNDVAGLGPAGVQAILDLRPVNIASEKALGYDVAASYDTQTPIGELSLKLNGAYIKKLRFRPAATTPALELENTVYNPIRLRIRGGATLSNGGWSASSFINYAGHYRNTLFSPSTEIDSWTTADIQLNYKFQNAAGILHGLSTSVSVQNLFDSRPPVVARPASQPLLFNLGYDPTNASALGRFVAVRITKQW